MSSSSFYNRPPPGQGPNSQSPNKPTGRGRYCSGCQQYHPLDSFSKSQLRRPQRDNVFCKGCTPKQVLELLCGDCHEKKPIAEFSKNQRREGEDAICLKCNYARHKQGRPQQEYVDDSSDVDESEYQWQI